MKATVKVINPNRGMYAAEIEGRGEYVIFELLDSSGPEVDDIVLSENFYSMGGATFENVTQHCRFNVFVENVCGSNQVRKLCLF